MKKRKPVSHIMTKELRTLDAYSSELEEAKEMMEANNIRHLPVQMGGKLVGMISLTDINRVSFGSNFNQDEVDTSIFKSLSIPQVMKKNLTTIHPNTPIKEAAEILSKEEFHALPVVNNQNELEGIVTSTDLIDYLLDQY